MLLVSAEQCAPMDPKQSLSRHILEQHQCNKLLPPRSRGRYPSSLRGYDLTRLDADDGRPMYQ